MEILTPSLVALGTLLSRAYAHRAKELLASLALGSFGLSCYCLASFDSKVLVYQCQRLRVDLREQVAACVRALDQ